MINPSLVAQVLLVGFGGFIGSIARFVLSGWVHRVSPDGGLPLGTLVVNVVGCLLIGFIGGLMELRQVLGPVLGGFTTFSTFAFETLGHSLDSEYLKATVNIAGQVVLGLGAAWLGYFVAQNL